MLKKSPSGKVKVTKNALFFLSKGSTQHSINFNSQLFWPEAQGFKKKHKLLKRDNTFQN